MARSLIQRLENEYPNYLLSYTVLFGAFKFLSSEGAINTYWKKLEGRGRPRRVYHLNDEWIEEVKKLAYFWMDSAV